MRILLLLACLLSLSLFGFEVKCCKILDPAKHTSNQQLLTAIIEEHLSTLNTSIPEEQAQYLRSKISKMADTALKSGFALDAYGVPEIDENSIAAYHSFALWEGETHSNPIPLTVFVYVWPSEEFSTQYHPTNANNSSYRTIIHSHPIPCAFAVLDGILIQNNYELVFTKPTKTVRFTGIEYFQRLEGGVDENKDSFIHQVYTRGSGSKPVISLHAYGLSTLKKVRACFLETRPLHAYNHILQDANVN